MKILNKKARLNYHILKTVEAGVVLTGAEVKSLRENRADLSESFAKISGNSAVLKNAYIFPYNGSDSEGYDPRHDRKLLLHKSELDGLRSQISGSSVTLIPLSIYTTRNFIKVELGLAASKKKYDHKKALKEADEKRRLEQELKGY